MKKPYYMEDALSLEEKANVKRANDALSKSDAKTGYILSGWTTGFDYDTKDVLICIPICAFRGLINERKTAFLNVIREIWRDAKFEIIQEEKLNVDAHVGFYSHFFRLKNIV